MAGAQVEIIANQIDKQRLGYMGLSLTNYDADTEPQIAAGSIVEVAGALFEFASAESITGWAGIGTSNDVYIKLVVSGTAVTAEFTTTAPTWSTSKQGLYGTAGSALHRYVARLYKDGAGDYTLKQLMRTPGREKIVVQEMGADSIDTAQLVDKAVQSDKLDDSNTYSTQAIGTSSAWVVPAGLYIMNAYQAGGTAYAVYLQIYSGSDWVPTGFYDPFSGGLVLSDGTNVRLYNADSSDAATVVYRKFS